MAYINFENILAVMGVGGGLFAVYSYFREPDIQARQSGALLTQRLDAIDKKMSNDLPHIDQQIKQLNLDIHSLKTEVVKLATIVEERMPKRRRK